MGRLTGVELQVYSGWTRVQLACYSSIASTLATNRWLLSASAFIELEEGIDGLLHVSDMSWARKISHPSEVLTNGQMVKCRILSMDQSRRQIALGLNQSDDDAWDTTIPAKYQPGQLVRGAVTKITNFGVFVGLEDSLEGQLYISDQFGEKVDNPADLIKVGDEIEIKVLRVDSDARMVISEMIVPLRSTEVEVLPMLKAFLETTECMIANTRELNSRIDALCKIVELQATRRNY